jgi:hypothetical protein
MSRGDNNMADMIETNETKEDTVETLTIGQLRQYAKLLNIPSERNWTKDDYIGAIERMRSSKNTAEVVFNDGGASGPAPGYARIILNRDPTPGHANSPVQVGVNGELLHVPRGVQVDIPEPFMRALANATTRTSVQTGNPSRDNPGGVFREEDTMSYPFQVIAITPANKPWRSKSDSRGAHYAMRLEFVEKFGRWPTDGELKEAVKAKLLKM